MPKNGYITIFMILALALVVGCGGSAATPNPAEEGKGPVTVASMIDSEGATVGKMMVIALEEDGFEVNDRTEFGTPDILRQALLAGEVDLVLDYTGSGQYYHDVDDTDPWSDAAAGYELTRELDLEANDIVWLHPAPANNTEMIAVRREFAETHGLEDMRDLADYVNEGGTLKLITSASFAENVKGLLGYEQAYGFNLAQDQLIVLSAGNTAEMLKALVEGTNDVNASLVYGTDGALEQMDLVVLDDPESIPPVYLPTPVLRGELHERYPEIETILRPIFESLTLETLQRLNAQVAYEGRDAMATARQYLVDNGFIGE